ncbi:MAG: methyl-accepting chemotaxis protein [Methylophilaceae bacterium]
MFKNMTFKNTTMMGFGVIIALFVSVLIFLVYQIHNIQSDVAEIDENLLPYELLADQMTLDAVQVQQYLTDASATHDRDPFGDAEKHAKSFKKGIQNFKGHYASSPDKLKELEAIDQSFDAYYSTGKHMAETYIAQGMEAGNLVMEGFDQQSLDIQTKMGKFRDVEVITTTNKVREINDTGKLIIKSSLIGGLVCILVAVLFAWKMSGNLLMQLGIEPMYARGIAREIAKGNLTRDIMLEPGDKTSLLYAIGSMQIQLRGMIKGMTENAQSIVQAAHQLGMAADNVLHSSIRQNDAASSVASAVEEMSASIDNISSNAEHSESMAKNAGTLSDQGGQVVADAVNEMNKIADSVTESSNIIRELGASSQKISDVVKVIKDIADQTNLLALNAAIEAARAGEQGRGFAVVADEVRKLAERTSKSTQEISGIIAEIQQGANNAVASMEQGTVMANIGVQKAERAGNSMVEIKQGTVQVVTTAGEITHALKEQRSAVNSVVGEVDTISKMAQENGEFVGQLTLTSAKLNELADSLNNAISYFKT